MQQIMLAVLICSAVSLNGFGQAAAGVGGISGTVTDSTGAVVPDATVTVSNPQLGIRRDLKTTGGGVFSAPALVPSSGYSVTITAPGFAEFKQENIVVQVGQTVTIPARLAVASATTRLEVTEVAPVDIKTDVSQNVNENQIKNLPINGRRVDSFVLLTPGVVPDGTFGLLSFRGIPGGNNFMTDGNDTTETFYNENAGRTRIPTQISQDAVQEFQVLSDAYSAEYGRALGGVVNTVTRSGTNQYHGTGFWFFRNRTLDARDPFASFNPSEVRHQFGGSLGGPIVKDKLFFFADTEEQLRDFPLVSSIINPSVINSTTKTWIGCGVAGGGLPAASPAQCAAINGVLPRFFSTLPRTANQQTAFLKIDWRPNDVNSFSFSGNYQHFNSPNGVQTGAAVTNGGAINSNGIDDVGVRYGRADWTFVPNGRMVNEARFGWFKDRQSDALNNALLDPVYGGLSLSVNGQAVGMGNYLPRINPSENRYEGADNFSYVVGKHNFKFGVDYFNTEDYTNELINGNGSYTFPNANAFALDYSGNSTGRKDYTSYLQAFGNRVVDDTINEANFYAQDQYRVTPQLTLYYGLRYEHTFMPKPPLVNPDYPQTGRIPSYGLDFAPRVGFAWTLNHDRTVIRSGYGIYYARYPGAMINTLFTTNNLYQQSLTIQTNTASQAALGPVFPNLLSSPAGTPGAASVGFAAPNLRTPYSEQSDFAIQQAIGQNTSVTVSYMWSRAAEMFTMRDLNLPVLPTHSITYNVLNAAGARVFQYTTPVYLATDKLDRRYSRIIEVDNGGNSYYNGLSLQVQRRMAHGFEGTLAYTWSHAIDDNLGSAGSNLFLGSGSPSSLFNGDYKGNKGDSSLDVRQRLVINWLYQPTWHFSGKTKNFLLSGWQLSTITTISTGAPMTETLNVSSPLSTSQAAALGLPSTVAYTGTLNGFGGSGQVPWLDVNTMRLSNVYHVDARVQKTFPIKERFQTTLGFEVFNLTNTIAYTSLSSRGYSASGLTITPATGLGLYTASAGFPDGTNARRAQAELRLTF
ncbi:MAG TPA: carboxypeptidase regulatory-like domain-containing protein [Bryobacteraceae bacterium]|nr:carboxypeptidase regulatory-like domain-containing protein [Bryobacteraceae bacterium]